MKSEKFFEIFNSLPLAQMWISNHSNLMIEVNSEVYSDGRVVVKYRSEVGRIQ